MTIADGMRLAAVTGRATIEMIVDQDRARWSRTPKTADAFA
jgi:hypothetical protein